VKEIAGLKFKVPQKYAAGTTMSGNIIDGVDTGHSYQSQDLIITINDTTNKTENLMNSDTAGMTVLTINGTEIQVFDLDGKSTALFEVQNNNVTMEWSSNDITPEIKAIISSFIQENK